MITLTITIVVLVILATIAINGSTRMIGDSAEAKAHADAAEDNDVIRKLLTHAITDDDLREGIALVDNTLVVIGSGDKEYGSGYYLIPGGDNKVLNVIIEEVGSDSVKKYKNLTAPYVVDYDNGDYERIEQIRFK